MVENKIGQEKERKRINEKGKWVDGIKRKKCKRKKEENEEKKVEGIKRKKWKEKKKTRTDKSRRN